jgi:hypothetical protein
LRVGLRDGYSAGFSSRGVWEYELRMRTS